MKQILKFILFFAILKIIASVAWERWNGRIINGLEFAHQLYKLECFSHENGSIATFKGVRVQDFKSVYIKIVLLKDDQDDSKALELIQENYKIQTQLKGIFVDLCLIALSSNDLAAFLASDFLIRSLNLVPLDDLNVYNLTGAEVIDYANPITHPNEVNQLVDFVLKHQIPPQPLENIRSVFYLATISKRRGKGIKNVKAIVVIPIQADNCEFLKNESDRLKAQPQHKRIFQRFNKNGMINGRLTPFLAIKYSNEIFFESLIHGLKHLYVMYGTLIGETINFNGDTRIHFRGKIVEPFFQSLFLTDYHQNTNVTWGLFKSKIIPLDSTNEQDAFEVNVKLCVLAKTNSLDWLLLSEHTNMLSAGDKYEFICYCQMADILNKKVAFLAYRERDSSSDAINPKIKR